MCLSRGYQMAQIKGGFVTKSPCYYQYFHRRKKKNGTRQFWNSEEDIDRCLFCFALFAVAADYYGSCRWLITAAAAHLSASFIASAAAQCSAFNHHPTTAIVSAGGGGGGGSDYRHHPLPNYNININIIPYKMLALCSFLDQQKLKCCKRFFMNIALLVFCLLFLLDKCSNL